MEANTRMELSKSRGVIYHYPNPDYSIDIRWLKKILPEAKGRVYFASGEANYNVYSEIERELRAAIQNGADIHFITGPIISVPELTDTEKVSQKERENLSQIIKLAKENLISLYPAEKRRSKHYRVFEEKRIVSAFEVHGLCELSKNLWYYYDDDYETALRIEEFEINKRNNGSIKVDEKTNLSEYFVFLDEKEICELKDWAKTNRMNTKNISYKECRDFLNLKMKNVNS